MNQDTTQLDYRITELEREFNSLKKSSSIPLDIDQAFRARFNGLFKIVTAGIWTTQSGATQTIITNDIIPTDISIVTLHTVGASSRTVLRNNCGTGSISVVMSGDPSTDHKLNYVVFRKIQ